MRTAPATYLRDSLSEGIPLLVLAVCQRIHRVNDNRLDTLAGTTPQDMVHGWNNVGQALARSRATRQDVGLVFLGLPDRFRLVCVQEKLFAGKIGVGLVDAKDLGALWVQK